MPSASPVAVVTGGAGGIGAAICEALAAAGFALVVVYRSSAATALALAETLRERYPGVGHVAMPSSTRSSRPMYVAPSPRCAPWRTS